MIVLLVHWNLLIEESVGLFRSNSTVVDPVKIEIGQKVIRKRWIFCEVKCLPDLDRFVPKTFSRFVAFFTRVHFTIGVAISVCSNWQRRFRSCQSVVMIMRLLRVVGAEKRNLLKIPSLAPRKSEEL